MPSQTLTFPCPFCGRKMGVGTDLLGKMVRCPHCKQKLLAPTSSETQANKVASPASVAPPPPSQASAPPSEDNPFSFNASTASISSQKPAPVPPPLKKSVGRAQQPNTPSQPVQPKTSPEPLPLDDDTGPTFNFPKKKEAADSILSEPGESEDEIFGSPGGNKMPIPTLPEMPPPPPPPAAAYAQPVPVPILIPPPAAPAPVAQSSANPFSFEMDDPPAQIPPVSQPRQASPQPVPPVAPTRSATPQPVPIPVQTLPKPTAPGPIQELPEEEPALKTKQTRGRRTTTPASGISMPVFFAVAGYAVLVTVAAIYGLFIKSGEKVDPSHPLSTIPDSFGEFDPVSRKKVTQYKFPIDGELPPNQKGFLGSKIEIGQLEIEPVKVEVRPLKVITESQIEKPVETRKPTLVMQLRIKNTSSDLSIFPMDPALTRKARSEDKQFLGTRLVIGKKTYFGGGIEWPVAVNVKRKYEEQQEKDNVPLKPGETREYVVFTESDPQIVKTVKESSDAILWRVQVRRGLIEYRGKDVPVTAIIGVEFKASDVVSSD